MSRLLLTGNGAAAWAAPRSALSPVRCVSSGMGSTTRPHIHHGNALTAAADRIDATFLQKLAGDGAADVVEGPGAQRTTD